MRRRFESCRGRRPVLRGESQDHRPRRRQNRRARPAERAAAAGAREPRDPTAPAERGRRGTAGGDQTDRATPPDRARGGNGNGPEQRAGRTGATHGEAPDNPPDHGEPGAHPGPRGPPTGPPRTATTEPPRRDRPSTGSRRPARGRRASDERRRDDEGREQRAGERAGPTRRPPHTQAERNDGHPREREPGPRGRRAGTAPTRGATEQPGSAHRPTKARTLRAPEPDRKKGDGNNRREGTAGHNGGHEEKGTRDRSRAGRGEPTHTHGARSCGKAKRRRPDRAPRHTRRPASPSPRRWDAFATACSQVRRGVLRSPSCLVPSERAALPSGRPWTFPYSAGNLPRGTHQGCGCALARSFERGYCVGR